MIKGKLEKLRALSRRKWKTWATEEKAEVLNEFFASVFISKISIHINQVF